jgi:hypothetical protein
MRPSSCNYKEPRHKPAVLNENVALQAIRCELSINLQKVNSVLMLDRPKYPSNKCVSTLASTELSKTPKKSIASQAFV